MYLTQCITQHIKLRYCDNVISAGLTQCVDFCMRGRNTLDLVFTDDQLVSSVVADETFGDSDHNTVKFVIVLESTDNQTHVLADDTRFVWSKANFDLRLVFVFY